MTVEVLNPAETQVEECYPSSHVSLIVMLMLAKSSANSLALINLRDVSPAAQSHISLVNP